ncbi:MAG: hypothetical protein IPN39_15850 [Chitinophagaceae bacterium]|nr:hypothetical protein [Chitinophagaceae bacterium]
MGRLGIILLSLLLLATSRNYAQGCSDAGVCTIDAIKQNTIPGRDIANTNNWLSAGTGYAKGERGTNIYTMQLEYTRRVAANLFVTGKLSYNYINGELGNSSGPGDLFLTIEKKLKATTTWKKSVFTGLKIPFTSANKKINELDLPMVYQPGLGTTDLLLGITASTRFIGFSLAFQQPLSGSNNNNFLPSLYPLHSDAKNYPATNKFSRKADIVARISRNFNAEKKLSFSPGLLGILHTGNDSYIDENNNRQVIEGSGGFTLNATTFLQYAANKKNSIGLSAGIPLIVRAERPDGLTRKFVMALEYSFNF